MKNTTYNFKAFSVKDGIAVVEVPVIETGILFIDGKEMKMEKKTEVTIHIPVAALASDCAQAMRLGVDKVVEGEADAVLESGFDATENFLQKMKAFTMLANSFKSGNKKKDFVAGFKALMCVAQSWMDDFSKPFKK